MLLFLLLWNPYPGHCHQRRAQLRRQRKPPDRPQSLQSYLSRRAHVHLCPDGVRDTGQDRRREVLVRDQQTARAALVRSRHVAGDEDGRGCKGQVWSEGYQSHSR